MLKARSWRLLILSCTLATACNRIDDVVAPSSGLGGEWSGTTAQGAPIAFTMSADDRVTSLTIGYAFNGCSGSQTFSNLSLPLEKVSCTSPSCPAGLPSVQAFSYTATSSDGASTRVNGGFPLAATAEGIVDFTNYPGCGSAAQIRWSATRP
jgi:hypothetical protein